MALVNLNQVLPPARKAGYAVGAFNAISMDMALAIIDAAEAVRSPVIVNIAELHFPYFNLEKTIPLIIQTAQQSSVPVVLHLDHGRSFEILKMAIGLGFTSVMIDASDLSFMQNLALTKQCVEYCKIRDISIEAELGAVGGSAESEVQKQDIDKSLFTDVKQAEQFISETGIDALAVAIGNCHGVYKKDPNLDFDLLKKLNRISSVPLVLHGGSGINDQDFKKAITLGISKINFYTGIAQAALSSLAYILKDNYTNHHVFPILLEKIKASITKTVQRQFVLFGSTDHA